LLADKVHAKLKVQPK